MNLTIKNQTSIAKSYLGGLITVAEDSYTTISRVYNVILAADAEFVSDVVNYNVIINNGVQDLKPENSLRLIEALTNFATDKLATTFLYYSFPVDIVQTATTNSTAVVWAIRNPLASPYSLMIEEINLWMSYANASPLIPTTLKYELITFSGGSPSGGSSFNAAKASRLAPTFSAIAQYLDTGLTMSGVTFDSTFAKLNLPAIIGGVSSYQKRTCIHLAPGEGLAIRLADTALIGQNISGEIVGSLR